MSARRRRPATRRAKVKGLPRWAVLALGLVIGVVLAFMAQFISDRLRSSDSGLSHLFSRTARPADTPGAGSAPAAAKPAAKPTYDFYTLLPEIETVLPAKETRGGAASRSTRSERGASYMLQAGSFPNFDDADRLKAKLALAGLVAQIEKVTIQNRGEYFRVRLGPYERLEMLDATNKLLAQQGIKAMRLKVKKPPRN